MNNVSMTPQLARTGGDSEGTLLATRGLIARLAVRGGPCASNRPCVLRTGDVAGQLTELEKRVACESACIWTVDVVKMPNQDEAGERSVSDVGWAAEGGGAQACARAAGRACIGGGRC